MTVTDDRIWYTADAVTYQLTVRDRATGDLLDLSGMAITARARSPAGTAVVSGTATAAGPGTVDVTFAPGALARGSWIIQHRIVPAGEDGETLRPDLEIEIRASF